MSSSTYLIHETLIMAYIGEGRRKGKILAYRGFIYQKNRMNANFGYWRCAEKTCRAPLKTNSLDVNNPPARIDVLEVGDHHGHLPDIQEIEKLKVLNTIKSNVAANPTAPIKRMYDDTVSALQRQQNPLDLEDIPIFEDISQTLKRKKTQNVPPIPATIDDVRFNGPWKETWDGQNNLMHLDNNWGIAIFGTRKQTKMLRRAKTLYVDGTFRSAPHPYKQIYTIHAEVRGHVVTVATCLMLNKNTGSYRQVIQALKTAVRQVTGRRWRPTTIIVDFELAAINAFQSEFRNISVKGCYFHFNQALWKHIQDLGLTRAYKNDRRVKKLVKKIMALGFLPIPHVARSFWNLRTSQRTRRLVRRYQNLAAFIDYVDNTYMNGQFPPAMWNVYSRPMETRTNNVVESFHRRWNQAVGVRHPSLWVFTRVMKDQQAISEVKISDIRNGRPPPRRRQKWRRLEERIVDLKARFTNGNLTLEGYWESVKYVILNR